MLKSWTIAMDLHTCICKRGIGDRVTVWGGGLTWRDVKHCFPLNQLMIVKFVLLSPSRAKNSFCLHQAITINSSYYFVKNSGTPVFKVRVLVVCLQFIYTIDLHILEYEIIWIIYLHRYSCIKCIFTRGRPRM